MKTLFHSKLLYSSAIASTHSSASGRPIASQYEWGMSAVRNVAPVSSSLVWVDGLPSWVVLPFAPTEGLILWVSLLAVDLEPSSSVGSSLACLRGTPLLVLADLQTVGGVEVVAGDSVGLLGMLPSMPPLVLGISW